MAFETKIVKNTTVLAITLKNVGITIPANDFYTIEISEYNLWATVDALTEISPLITAGDIVVNDSIVDITDLIGCEGATRYPDVIDKSYERVIDVGDECDLPVSQ